MPPSSLRFSIVVTCFNYERFVGKAVESALGQTYKNTEVIVIDDGSTDDSSSVISAYSGRVRSIRQTNGGHIAACNRGFEESTGDLVLFLDADDVIDPLAAELCVKAWQANAAKIQFDLRLIDAAGSDLNRRLCYFAEDYDAAQVRESFLRTGTYAWPVTAGNAYARGFLERVMPLRIKLAPDGHLNTIAPVYGDVVTVPECLGSYRLHGKNAWSSNGADFDRLPSKIAQRIDEVQEMRRHAKQNGVRLPDVDPLNFEFTFVDYRLLAKRLGLAYANGESDSRRFLWSRGVRLLRDQNLSFRRAVAQLGWFSVIAWCPTIFVRPLLSLRQRRRDFLESLRAARRSEAEPEHERSHVPPLTDP